MSKIELNKEHKVKLIQIVNNLFPEYTTVVFSPLTFDIMLLISEDDDVYIHWFEFCAMDLATKLYNLNNRSEISTIELYRGNIIQNYHPVDYLYQEYLFYRKNE